MHNICDKITTNLEYNKENGKQLFIQTNVIIKIQSSLTTPSTWLISTQVIRRSQIYWSNNQTRFKTEKPCK